LALSLCFFGDLAIQPTFIKALNLSSYSPATPPSTLFLSSQVICFLLRLKMRLQLSNFCESNLFSMYTSLIPQVVRFLKAKLKAKHAASTFPPNWPSHLHSKCTIPTCYHPNPPQAAAGKYNCLGSSSGLSCSGTYKVSPSMAKDMVKNYNFVFTLPRKDGRSKPLRTVKPRRHGFGLPDEGSRPDVGSPTQYGEKQDTSQEDDSWKNKQLPPIPGLHLRKVQRNRVLSPYPPFKDDEQTSTPWHAQTHHQQLYPQSVQQSSSGVKSAPHPQDSAISLPRSLAPVRRSPVDRSLEISTGNQRPYVHPK